MTKVPENVVSSGVRRIEVAVNSISIRSRSLSRRPSLVGPGVSLQTVSAIEPVIWPAFTLNLNGCDRVDAGERLSGIKPLWVGRFDEMLFMGALPAQGIAR